MANPMTAREALNSVLSKLFTHYPKWEPSCLEARILTALVVAHEAKCRAIDVEDAGDGADALHDDAWELFYKLRSLERGEEGSRG